MGCHSSSLRLPRGSFVAPHARPPRHRLEADSVSTFVRLAKAGAGYAGRKACQFSWSRWERPTSCSCPSKCPAPVRARPATCRERVALRGRVMALVVTLASAAAPVGLLLGSAAGGMSAHLLPTTIGVCGAGMSVAAVWSLRVPGSVDLTARSGEDLIK